jgi:hypothetical protein
MPGKESTAKNARRERYDPDAVPRGVLLCVLEMYGCVERPGGVYGWKLRNVRKIKPVKVRGRLGLWNSSR